MHHTLSMSFKEVGEEKVDRSKSLEYIRTLRVYNLKSMLTCILHNDAPILL